MQQKGPPFCSRVTTGKMRILPVLAMQQKGPPFCSMVTTGKMLILPVVAMPSIGIRILSDSESESYQDWDQNEFGNDSDMGPERNQN